VRRAYALVLKARFFLCSSLPHREVCLAMDDVDSECPATQSQRKPPSQLARREYDTAEEHLRALESMGQLNPAQPTRFGAHRVPPHLYLIVERDEWECSASVYLPRGRAYTHGVPLCDLDRLDSVAARNYFLQEYKAAIARSEQVGTLDTVLGAASSVLNRLKAVVSSAPIGTAKLLNGNAHGASVSHNDSDVERRSGLHTRITEHGEHLVRLRSHALVILEAAMLEAQDALAWDGGSDTHDYPRLKRPVKKCEDVWVEFPLVYDTKKFIVATPDAATLSVAFEKATLLVAGSSSRN